MSFVVTGLSSRIGARLLLMDRPRGVGDGTMSAPRIEDPERERSGSMPESAIGMARVMAWPASGMALATMAVRVMVLPAIVMVSLAPALALLLLLLPLLPALVLAGTRARRPELKRRHEAPGLVRGWRQQQLPRLQAAVAAAEA